MHVLGSTFALELKVMSPGMDNFSHVVNWRERSVALRFHCDALRHGADAVVGGGAERVHADAVGW